MQSDQEALAVHHPRKRYGALRVALPVMGVFLWHAAAQALPDSASGPVVDYNRDIRPILAANCFSCHGPDEGSRQANLRLDTHEGATALRGTRRAVEPGNPEKSSLVARINSDNPGLLMPPVASGHKLTREQKELLVRWVRQGAPYAQHWAFVPVRKPALPRVKRLAWVRNPIDTFVLARLEQQGLLPAPEADRYTLIRRLALDLTGLPPTSDLVSAFVNDPAPDAYEKVVHRLLASPRFGEHWARMWLDLARYADTQGYEKDQPRVIWRYRDWVIDAFNADMPYDRFTVEQLAGDLLPKPTSNQILATAFHRNTMTNTEGGVDPEEFRMAAVKDRVDTTMQVWMGLTMGCAKCHTHKYDPISHQEYYQFLAFFNQTEDANRANEEPVQRMPTAEQDRYLTTVDQTLRRLREEFWKPVPALAGRQPAWEREIAAKSEWAVLRCVRVASDSGANFQQRSDGAILVSGARKDKDTYTVTLRLPHTPIRALRLEALKDNTLPNGGPGRDGSDQNVVTSELKVELLRPGQKQPEPVALVAPRADFEQSGFPVANAIDGKPETGWAWSPRNAQPHAAVFEFKTPVTAPEGSLVVTIRQEYPKLQFGCFRLSVSSAEGRQLRPEVRSLSELAATPPDQRTSEEQSRLNEAFRQMHEPTAGIYRQLDAMQQARAELVKEIPSIPIMRELPPEKRRTTRIHLRGNFLDPGAEVSPAVPASFHPFPPDAPKNRLGVAQWLVSRENPLTPRVAVNRVWARLFGTGLVETEEDFGTQGTLPTHPELLDWLAATFRDDLGWSHKQLIKTIVLSSTYRQAGRVSPEKEKADPRNLLFSRGPRFRLPAETIRDQSLAVSGLLSGKIGGPPVMPPQPDGLWKSVYSGLKWETSEGEDRYRRALYTLWRRTTPYPSLATFDAGSGEFCLVRRIRTNTPLQALVTLNDPAFVEAAGALGKDMLQQTLRGPRERLAYGFRRVLVRNPDLGEVTRLLRLYEEALADFRARPKSAEALLSAANTKLLLGADVNEQAAYTVVANVLLNLDETLTKP